MNCAIGGFHMEEIDRKQYFVYHLNSFGEDMASQSLFVCPKTRFRSVNYRYVEHSDEKISEDIKIVEINCSPYFNNKLIEGKNKNSTTDGYEERERLDLDNHHYVLPLFWCNNKKEDDFEYCDGCGDYLKVGSDYYFCVECDKIHHKECVESPFEINHPYHPNHPLKLCNLKEEVDCVHCEKSSRFWVYHCNLCNFNIDSICAQKSIPFVIDQPKRHGHPLTFFTRRSFLDCNICGLVNKSHSTYVCVKCNFVAHQDCAYFPSVIRISRHQHRILFASSLLPEKWSCGVCRKNVDSGYGGYTCNKCDGYVVHSRCALRKDIWDGEELEGIPEEDDIEDVIEPFKALSDGLILHFLHEHVLKLETSGEIYDGNNICDACVLPIYEGDFYSCIECDFILHDTCANAPRKIRHPLHPHPLTLKINSGYDEKGYSSCDVCNRRSSGFIYECNTGKYCFTLDVRCGSIFEPFEYEGHTHPLFLALDPREKNSCQVCQTDDRVLINCIECDFIRCFECVTLPYLAKYKHDKHFLELSYWEEANEPDWCEVCEKLIFSEDDNDRRFYKCKQCCTTLHLKCLLGKELYMKPDNNIIIRDMKVQILPNNSLSRPTCNCCYKRCVDTIVFRIQNKTFCSSSHALFF